MRRIGSAGLAYRQIFALIFGFLITSVLIFLFGVWVGRELGERRLARDQRVVRAPIPERPTTFEDEADPEVDREFYENLKQKAYERVQRTGVAAATPTRAPQPVAQHTATPIVRATIAVRRSAEPAQTVWTVQVNATTDAQQALTLTLRLKGKGYDAYTTEAAMSGQTWYRVRVGRLASRTQAQELQARLRRAEGLSGAYVTLR